MGGKTAVFSEKMAVFLEKAAVFFFYGSPRYFTMIRTSCLRKE
jgi:hypothetical protein